MTQFGPKSSGEEVAAHFAGAIKGKVVLVTGVSLGGLGGEFCKVISPQKPKLLILAGRNVEKLQATAAEIEQNSQTQTRLLQLDLDSLDAVRNAAKEVLAYKEPIDVLVNNAGIMAVPYSKTADGIEHQFAANHVAHFLFTNLIMPRLLAAPEPRIVSVSSDGHRFSGVRFGDIDFNNGKDYDRWISYGQAKTANILFASELVRRLHDKAPQLQAYSVHPGVITSTNLGTHLRSSGSQDVIAEIGTLDRLQGHPHANRGEEALKSVSQGVSTHIVAAFSPDLVKDNGGYLEDCEIMRDPAYFLPHANNPADAARLWTVSEEMVGQKFEY